MTFHQNKQYSYKLSFLNLASTYDKCFQHFSIFIFQCFPSFICWKIFFTVYFQSKKANVISARLNEKLFGNAFKVYFNGKNLSLDVGSEFFFQYPSCISKTESWSEHLKQKRLQQIFFRILLNKFDSDLVINVQIVVSRLI